MHEYRFADCHCVDETLRNTFGGICCVVLGLARGRATGIIESETLAERKDEVDEV